MEILLLGAALASIVLFGLVFAAKQYRRCASDEVLVVFGKVRGGKTAECVHGGGRLIIPLIQDYKYLSLRPMAFEVPLKGALSKNNIRVNVPSSFTIAISRNPAVLTNAAERLLSLTQTQMIEQARDIIIGQMRLVIANMTIEEINLDREKFLGHVNENVGQELAKLGLELINVNVQDITDESGYIIAIGKNAAAEAVQKALVLVSEQERSGALGVAEATRLKEVGVATQQSQTSMGRMEAERNQRVKNAALQAEIAEGENASKAKTAQYNATLAEAEANALQKSQVARANAEKAVSLAQKDAETAKLQKEEVVRQEVNKQKATIAAEAQADATRIEAQGAADATRLRYAAEAEGIQKVLTAKAEGYERLAKAAGSSAGVANLLMIEKLDSVVKAQAEMVKGIKIDKITVWDSGNNETSGFMQQFGKMLPPLHEVAKGAGIELPTFMGTTVTPTPTPSGKNGSGNGARA